MDKKRRFPLLAKVLLLSGALTIFVVTSALVIGTAISYQKQKDNFSNYCETSGYKVRDLFETNVESQLPLFTSIFDKYEEVADKYSTLTEKEKYTYITNLNDSLFGKSGAIGLSLDMAKRTKVYDDFYSGVTAVCNEYDVGASLVKIYDSSRNLTISFFNSTLLSKEFPVGQIEEVSENELKLFTSSLNNRLFEENDCIVTTNKCAELPYNGKTYSFFLENNVSLSYLNKQIVETIITEVLISVGAAIVLMLVYALLAKKLLVNNIVKLSKSSKEFVQKIDENKKLDVVETGVKSNDEVGEAYRDLIYMEEKMVSYVDSIEEATKKEERMKAELSVAGNIQLEALPENLFFYKNIELRAFIKPAKEVGGDFYDYFLIDKDNLAFVIADVSGKGIPASLLMMKTKETIKAYAMHEKKLSKLFFDINNQLCLNNKESYFVTAFFGVLNLKSLELRYISAGQERPFIIKNNKSKQIKVESNFALGLVEDFKYKEEKLQLSEGDMIFLHTDGLNEAINNNNEEYSYERIASSLDNEFEPKQKLEHVHNELVKFVGKADQFDDETMLLIEIKKDVLSLNYKNPKFENIHDATDKVSKHLKDVEKDTIRKINVVIDEVFNNIVSYNKSADEIDISVIKKDKEVVVCFFDNGTMFNPLDVKNKSVKENLENNVVGGLGISIIKGISKTSEYHYQNRQNILIVKF